MTKNEIDELNFLIDCQKSTTRIMFPNEQKRLRQLLDKETLEECLERRKDLPHNNPKRQTVGC